MYEPPPMDDRDVIEAHELQRRRTMAAFLWGKRPVARGAHNQAAQGLLIGAALAVVILLVIGIVALVGASRARQQQQENQQRAADPRPVQSNPVTLRGQSSQFEAERRFDFS